METTRFVRRILHESLTFRREFASTPLYPVSVGRQGLVSSSGHSARLRHTYSAETDAAQH